MEHLFPGTHPNPQAVNGRSVYRCWMKPWAQRMWWRTTWLCRLHRRRGWDGQTVAVDLFRGLLWSFDWKLLWTYCNICNVHLEFPIVPKTHSYKHGAFLRALQVGSWQMPCLLLEEMSPILRSEAISDRLIDRFSEDSIRRRYHRTTNRYLYSISW